MAIEIDQIRLAKLYIAENKPLDKVFLLACLNLLQRKLEADNDGKTE